MFAPIAVDNIDFPQRTSLSTLDFIPESFDAWQSYSNVPTSSTYTTQSFVTSINDIYRYGIASNGKILGTSEGGGSTFIWDTNTETSSSAGNISAGTIRNIVWDNLTNSWVICGSDSFVKVNCDTLATTSISVPTNIGSQYASVVAFGGKAYAAPYVNTGSGSAIAIFDLVSNTATTSSVKTGGIGGFWGAVLTSVGTIYFCREDGATTGIFEYDTKLDTGSNIINTTSITSPGYGITNLPDGTVFIPSLTTSAGTVSIINPVNKSIKNLSSLTQFRFSTGICVGQNGHVYAIVSSATTEDGIWGFNTTNQTAYKTQYFVNNPSSGGRGYQDLFSLADGRLIAMPGQNNSGLLTYYTYLSQPANNTISQVGAANPIITNGKGT